MTTRNEKIKAITSLNEGRLVDHLGIVFKSYERETLTAQMPVLKSHTQPAGLLHGGASVVLAESIASIGSWLEMPEMDAKVVGIEINANHLRSVSSGIVTGVGTPVRLGKKIHVWSIEIKDESGELVCISRCTVSVG